MTPPGGPRPPAVGLSRARPARRAPRPAGPPRTGRPAGAWCRPRPRWPPGPAPHRQGARGGPEAAVGHNRHGRERALPGGLDAAAQQGGPGAPVAAVGLGFGHLGEARQVVADPWAGHVVAVVGGQHGEPVRQLEALDPRRRPAVLRVAQPEGPLGIGHQEVEAAIGRAVERRQGRGGDGRLGVVQRFQHQLAAAALAGLGAQRPDAVQDRGGQAVVVEPEPGAAGGLVQARAALSSRLAARSRGQRWPGRRRTKTVHMAACSSPGRRRALADSLYASLRAMTTENSAADSRAWKNVEVSGHNSDARGATKKTLAQKRPAMLPSAVRGRSRSTSV